MPGRLAIDFGTSNTVVALWDEIQQTGIPFHLPDYGYFYQHDHEKISVIPSQIHYASDKRRWLGYQVEQQNLTKSDRTFRWMKRYISNRSPVQRKLDGKQISHFDAGKDFLSTVLLFAATELNLGDEEVAFTVPVEAFEHYENWLADVAEAAGIRRFRLIDEPSAAALGYGAHIQPGDVYLIFDFGGGTLDVAVVLIEESDQSQVGRRCRVLGKAGLDLGGATLDQWLFQDVLKQTGRNDLDEEVRQLSRSLLVECERAKVRLSTHERADVTVMNPNTGAVLSAEFSRSKFQDLLDDNEAFTQIDQTIRRALNSARERGYQEDDIKAVLLVGGSSQIPAIQSTVRRIFGKERVMLNRPLDAVARGAAAFVAGVDFYDHIQHDYAIRFLNRQKGEYDYRILVKRGTPYPTADSLARLTVKASYDGQTQLGLAIFEMGESRQRNNSAPMELVFDPSGAARLSAVTPEEDDNRAHFWMNESSPTFLHANPPASQGESRFQVEFSIDGNKRLLMTSRDLKTQKITHRDYPVVKLT
ncbi:Hsp70 family protein [Pleurocapsales cyanobacterium LEGE 06147]|nr:Hsp70 family protein [Pleurocapsales cyanobacterium LEGE 06147]